MIRLFLTAGLLVSVAASAQDGKLTVPPEVMAGHCLTTVSPQNAGLKVRSVVVVRALISASGKVSPARTVSGPSDLELKAMDAIRLWKYRPFVREGSPVAVVTDVRVVFEPGQPGGMIDHPNH